MGYSPCTQKVQGKRRHTSRCLSDFSLQRASEPRINWISEQMQNIMLTDAPTQPPKLKQGDLCLAVFSLDKQLYRSDYLAKAYSRN